MIRLAIARIKELVHINFYRNVRARARARARCLGPYQIGQPSFRPFSGDRRPAMLGVTVTVTVFLSLSLSRVTLGNPPRLPACKSI